MVFRCGRGRCKGRCGLAQGRRVRSSYGRREEESAALPCEWGRRVLLRLGRRVVLLAHQLQLCKLSLRLRRRGSWRAAAFSTRLLRREGLGGCSFLTALGSGPASTTLAPQARQLLRPARLQGLHVSHHLWARAAFGLALLLGSRRWVRWPRNTPAAVHQRRSRAAFGGSPAAPGLWTQMRSFSSGCACGCSGAQAGRQALAERRRRRSRSRSAGLGPAPKTELAPA